jgi:hypothetical protein
MRPYRHQRYCRVPHSIALYAGVVALLPEPTTNKQTPGGGFLKNSDLKTRRGPAGNFGYE